MSPIKQVVVSDAAPLIQLSLARHLNLLPRLYDVIVPEKVFEETQRYPELPDAIDIAKAAGKWLSVRAVGDKKEVARLREQKLDDGEAEAIVLCREAHAHALLTSDRYAALRAAASRVKVITLGDVIRRAYRFKVIEKDEVLSLVDAMVNQNILATSYMRELLTEARNWP